MGRWVRFIIAILVGVAAGLAYGWVVNPVEYIETSPASLKIDYKTDYVLMTAEIYRVEGNLDRAARRLAILGSMPPGEIVQQAMLFAEKAGYTEADRSLMLALYHALQTYIPGLETPAP